jgi:prepilin-type N-terminal cleavage/methylation domain-containing protein/prepilin-type processing-associated H-X9-DG protein
MNRPHRQGFTLVELLVVIAIIGILVALLLPAIQAAREAARRAQCTNNLKQVGIAIQSYHDAYRALPILGMGSAHGSWVLHLLPQLEQASLYEQYTFTLQWNYLAQNAAAGVDNLRVSSVRVATLTCPSDSDVAPMGTRAAHHNYVLCAGNAARGNLSSDADPQTYNGVAPRGAPFRFVTVSLNAASGWNIGAVVKDAPRQTLASILDGVSNTLASSEVIKGRDGTMMDGSAAFDRRGYVHWGDACSFTTLYTPNNAAPDRFDNGSRCANTATLPCSFGGPPYYIVARSRHPGGVNAGMLDGSVRFVSDSINWNTWQALGSSQGGESVGSY